MSLAITRRRPVTPRWILRLLWLIYRKPHFRPIWNANVVSHDLLGQARHLYESGFYIAAGMLARAYLERSLKRLCLITPTWRECRGSNVGDFIQFLTRYEVLDADSLQLVGSLYKRTSRICHAGMATKGKLDTIFSDLKCARKSIEEASLRALGRAG